MDDEQYQRRIKAAIRRAVKMTVAQIGLEALKRTSFFLSNQRGSDPAKKAAKALEQIKGDGVQNDSEFKGVTYATFDGVVKEIDSRGTFVRGKLILTAGGKELDCLFSKQDIEHLRNSFDRRAKIIAVAHYDGENLLPARLDVKKIELIEEDTQLIKWRGVLAGKSSSKVTGL